MTERESVTCVGRDFADGGDFDLEDVPGFFGLGGDDEIDEEDEEDVDHRNDRHLGAFAV